MKFDDDDQAGWRALFTIPKVAKAVGVMLDHPDPWVRLYAASIIIELTFAFVRLRLELDAER